MLFSLKNNHPRISPAASNLGSSTTRLRKLASQQAPRLGARVTPSPSYPRATNSRIQSIARYHQAMLIRPNRWTHLMHLACGKILHYFVQRGLPLSVALRVSTFKQGAPCDLMEPEGRAFYRPGARAGKSRLTAHSRPSSPPCRFHSRSIRARLVIDRRRAEKGTLEPHSIPQGYHIAQISQCHDVPIYHVSLCPRVHALLVIHSIV